MGFDRKNYCNRNLPTLLYYASDIQKKDVSQCPKCGDLELKEKVYIINIDDRTIEISGICGKCEETFNVNLTINATNYRRKDNKRSQMRRKRKQLENYKAKIIEIEKTLNLNAGDNP